MGVLFSHSLPLTVGKEALGESTRATTGFSTSFFSCFAGALPPTTDTCFTGVLSTELCSTFTDDFSSLLPSSSLTRSSLTGDLLSPGYGLAAWWSGWLADVVMASVASNGLASTLVDTAGSSFITSVSSSSPLCPLSPPCLPSLPLLPDLRSG